MNTHKNARLTFARRVELVRRAVMPGSNSTHLAWKFGVSRRTVWKWVQRYRTEAETGLCDHSSRPRRSPAQLPCHRRHQIVRAPRRRWSSVRIAQHYQLPVSAVVTIQRRLGLNRLGKIGRVGHRIHGDRTRRTRRLGWEYVHVAIDDCTRLACSEVLTGEDGPTTAGAGATHVS